MFRRVAMKRVLVIVLVLSLVVVAGLVIAADKSKRDLRAGDSVYACNCGEKCACKTLSRAAGKCSCGNEMVKSTVVKVDGDSAMLKAAGWSKERAFPTKGKYACACEGDCNCGTISQNPGKCACGNEMKKVI
jgi:hypothetical protein